MRKLILLALGAAAAWWWFNRDSEAAPAPPSPAPGGMPAQDIRTNQPAGAGTGEGVVPDTSADDPLVREQENAAAAEAGSVGGPADTITSEVDEEMRPVVEGSGDAEETFEQTEDQGR